MGGGFLHTMKYLHNGIIYGHSDEVSEGHADQGRSSLWAIRKIHILTDFQLMPIARHYSLRGLYCVKQHDIALICVLGCAHDTSLVWRPENSVEELVLSFHPVGCGDRTQGNGSPHFTHRAILMAQHTGYAGYFWLLI